jgi:molybdate/tungstate transport system substrate-binding protein
MFINRRFILAAGASFAALGASARRAAAAGKITVAYAGSMGVVMDQGIGPAFAAASGTQFQGIGQASMALAHLLAAKTMLADVFVSVSAGPVKVVEEAKLADKAIPVASTTFVLAYSPKSKFAAQFAAGKAADVPTLLTLPGLRFGRTDYTTDPQGAYVLYCLQLAALYYKQPGLAAKVAGADANPAQIFTEPSLLARLEAGQLDATLGYQSAVISQKLPYINLPPEIDFSTPALAKDWYAKAALTLKGKSAHPSPLVFYATALANAANPAGAQSFVDYLASPAGQALFAKYGYNPGTGKPV